MRTDAELISSINVTENKKASLYFDIKRNTLDDGPGIRTVLFFKGCPLSCIWCQNPEGINTNYELSFDAEKCISCGDCVDACPEGAIDLKTPEKILRDKCTLCFKCIDACPSGALKKIGRDTSDIEKIAEEILQDADFFEMSGGGVTVSGGEALMQMNTVSKLFKIMKKRNIHTLIQTAGLFNFNAFEKKVFPYTDTVYFDLKLIDSEEHQTYCGVRNEPILENFTSLQALAINSKLEVLPRIPLIPTITDTHKNLSGLADFMLKSGVKKIQLLPYNPIWSDKLPKIGGVQHLDIGEQTTKFMPNKELDRCIEIFARRGIHVYCHR